MIPQSSKIQEIKKTIKDRFIYYLLTIVFSAIFSTLIFKPINSFFYPDDYGLVYSISPSTRHIENKLYSTCFLCDEVKDTLYSDLCLYNKGNNYFDFSRILNGQQLTFEAESVTFVEIIDVYKTREDLSINIRIDSTKGKLIFDLLGKEAFERLDGVYVKLKYISARQPNWAFRGRIIGFPDGIPSISHYSILSKKQIKSRIIFSFLLIIMGTFILVAALFVVKHEIVIKIMYIFGGSLGIIMAIWFITMNDGINKMRPDFFDNQEIIIPSMYYECPDDGVYKMKVKKQLELKNKAICEEKN